MSLQKGLFSLVLIILTPQLLWGANRLVAKSDNISIYSGPGIRYRAIKIIGSGTKLLVSSRIVSNESGEYYKVLIKGKGKKRRIGYISTDAAVIIERSEDSEDIDKYKSLALAQSSFQASVSLLRQNTYVWQAGYLKYPAPGFYLKGFGGQILKDSSGAFMGGVEAGNDSLLWGAFSGYAAIALGLAFPTKDDEPFEGAKSGMNTYVGGTAGLRYNASEAASVSLGLGHTAIYNKNNSFTSLAMTMTFEIGL